MDINELLNERLPELRNLCKTAIENVVKEYRQQHKIPSKDLMVVFNDQKGNFGFVVNLAMVMPVGGVGSGKFIGETIIKNRKYGYSTKQW